MVKFGCSATLRVGFVYMFICREPAVTHMNDQRLTNLPCKYKHALNSPFALHYYTTKQTLYFIFYGTLYINHLTIKLITLLQSIEIDELNNTCAICK